MSIRKTLGGDRLGSGSKMQVDLHGYERSTHDLGFGWKSSMSAGTLVPFMSEICLPGDTWDIDLMADVMTHPTLGPLFGSYKVQLDVFECPIRLYIAPLHNNQLKVGMNMSAVKFPLMELMALEYVAADTPDIDNSQINPSCILAYLGLRGIGFIDPVVGIPNAPREFNALSYISYCDVYKNYYANKQEEIGAVIHTPAATIVTTIVDVEYNQGAGDIIVPQAPATPISAIMTNNTVFKLNWAGTAPIPYQILFNTSIGAISAENISYDIDVIGTTTYVYFDFSRYGAITLYSWRYISRTQVIANEPQVFTFPLENLDFMREFLMGGNLASLPLQINTLGLPPYSYVLDYNATGTQPRMASQEGLLLKTYQSDLLNNWLQTEWIDGAGGITELTSIDTSGGSFTIDSLNLAKKLYNMLNRIAVSDGSYNSWIEVQYDNQTFGRTEIPIYHGGLIKELAFQEVVSNSASANEPLGTLAGKGVMTSKNKGGKISVRINEPGYLLGIVSITPRISYSQGNQWDLGLLSMDDLHKPALDEIGFQDLQTEQMAWWDTSYNLLGGWIQKSAGKQPAWVNYMTEIDKVRGNFAIQDNEMFMTLNRRYEYDNGTIKDLTTYIDPKKFNFIFAQTALDAQNFWVQIKIDKTVRRKMSAKIMPNL